MKSYQRGDVVLVPFPFTDLTTTKQRPALVVSKTSYNERHADIVVVAITSQPPRTTSGDVLVLMEDDCQAGGLLKVSYVIAGKIVTLDQRIIRKSIGKFPSATVKKIQARIAAVILE